MLIDLLIDVINTCFDEVKRANPKDLIARIKALGFKSSAVPVAFGYDDYLLDAVYFLKYGFAYAYEFAVIYEIVLSSYNPDAKNFFGTVSIGCGSSLDAWSLAYTKEKLGLKDLDLLYQGVDQVAWGVGLDATLTPFFYKYNPLFKSSVSNFFLAGRIYPYYNALFFPKMLSELSQPQINEIVATLKSATGFRKDREYFICISHAKNNYINRSYMHSVAEDIADAVNYAAGGAHNVIKKLPLGKKYSNLTQVITVSSPMCVPCYEFKPDPATSWYPYIKTLNPDFDSKDVDDAQAWLDEFIDVNCPGESHCTKRASTAAFQIIKLEPK